MKKILIIIIAVVVVVGAVVYMMFLQPPAPIKYEMYVPGEDFVTNVKDANRLLKTVIVLVYEQDPKLLEEMEAKQPVIRDTIIFMLRDLSEDDLKNTDTQDILRDSIVRELNRSFATEKIVNVLFNDYVMQ